MLTKNEIGYRCLVVSTSEKTVDALRQILPDMNYQTDFTRNRKEALQLFLQYKHALLCIDTDFLPRFPYRLEQLFKIAHRTPGILFFNHSEKNVLGFQYLKACIIEVVNAPFDQNATRSALTMVSQRNRQRTHRKFIQQVFIFGALMIPIILLLFFLLFEK